MPARGSPSLFCTPRTAHRRRRSAPFSTLKYTKPSSRRAAASRLHSVLATFLSGRLLGRRRQANAPSLHRLCITLWHSPLMVDGRTFSRSSNLASGRFLPPTAPTTSHVIATNHTFSPPRAGRDLVCRYRTLLVLVNIARDIWRVWRTCERANRHLTSFTVAPYMPLAFLELLLLSVKPTTAARLGVTLHGCFGCLVGDSLQIDVIDRGRLPLRARPVPRAAGGAVWWRNRQLLQSKTYAGGRLQRTRAEPGCRSGASLSLPNTVHYAPPYASRDSAAGILGARRDAAVARAGGDEGGRAGGGTPPRVPGRTHLQVVLVTR